MEAYRRTAKRRQSERDAAAKVRLQVARGVARQAADWLKETYSVGAVWLFGSLADNFDVDDFQLGKQTFTLTSDIDLAIGQLPPGDYFMAIALLQDISEFKIDLVQLDCIPSSFRTRILTGGKLL